MKLHVHGVIRINGINPYVLVSHDQAKRLKPGWRKPMPVRITVNGNPDARCRTNLMPVGDGSFFLYLNGEIRRASRTGVGDAASFTIEFDDGYRGGPVDPMPPWFAEPLQRNRAARKRWASLPPSRKKEILRYMGRLKSREAQQRNLERALHVLAGGNGRFMARSWNTDPRGNT